MSTTPKTLGQLVEEKTQARLNEEAGGTTIEEFENAPVGATATGPDGKRAVKTFNAKNPWRTEINEWHGYTMNSMNMVAAGYTLDPAPSTDLNHAIIRAEWRRFSEADQQLQALTLWTVPDLVEALARGRVHIAPGHDPALTAPTTAQEALDLAWELAHPVEEGQAIPPGTHYMLRHGLGYNLEVQLGDRRIDSIDEGSFRTLDPLPDPEPDWLDAPAVIATCGCHDGAYFVWEPADDGIWVCSRGENAHWGWLRDVTPLYPKEPDAIPADIPDTPLRSRAYLFHYGKPWSSSLGGDPA